MFFEKDSTPFQVIRNRLYGQLQKMDEWMNEWWKNDERMNKGWMNDKWMNEQMNEEINKWIKVALKIV